MARSNNPGRTLVVFFLGLALAYGLVALAGVWTPKLGLDLQGGTRITLVAEGDVQDGQLEEARKIIESRVNGSGVSESEVALQGDEYIVVEIPGESRRDLVETVKRQAQLRFRVVAQVANGVAGATGSSTGSSIPGVGELPGTVTESQAPEPGESPEGGKKKGKSSRQRAPLAWAEKEGEEQTESPSPSPTPSESPAEAPTEAPAQEDVDPLVWMNNPDPESLQAFQEFACPAPGEPADVVDDPDKPLVTCDENGLKYLLSAAMVEGTQLSGADVKPPDQQSVEWGVNLQFDGEGTKEFARISQALYNTDKQFAIVLDGQVISAPSMNAVITNGQAQITGEFTEAEATSLTTSLDFGALPISFQDDPQVELVGPSLAGNQLSAGLTAGAAGLGLVMLYCLFYYRGLGIVVLASLLMAATLTYAIVVLLSKGAGLTLSLPGIAGFIVAVGITADSFVVFFERIRDEMREGKSMKVAVESGWARARNTCLAADTVSLLAALVLYIFAAGVVKGFAFALGVSTLIDLVVFFWFTKPMVSWLARFRLFSSGHPLSGLSREALGVAERKDTVAAGGAA